MAIPSVVRTHHVHFRPRFFKTISKVGNRSVMARGSRGITRINSAYKGLIPVLNDTDFKNYQRSHLKPSGINYVVEYPHSAIGVFPNPSTATSLP